MGRNRKRGQLQKARVEVIRVMGKLDRLRSPITESQYNRMWKPVFYYLVNSGMDLDAERIKDAVYRFTKKRFILQKMGKPAKREQMKQAANELLRRFARRLERG